MKPLIILGLCCIIILPFDLIPVSAANTRQAKVLRLRPPVIGAIKSEINYGGGCHFRLAGKQRRNGELVFAYPDEATAPNPIMNINGKDVRLKQISEKRDGQGGILLEKYVYNDIIVILTYSHLGNSKEGSFYDARILAERGDKSTIVQITGYCGA
jgi:hypothetical protein